MSNSKKLERASWLLHNKLPFLGRMVQLMSTSLTTQVPTAGVMYDTKTRSLKLYVNGDFFSALSEQERVAVLEHEMYHILYKHTTYMTPDTKLNKMRLNIAMDLVINQQIANLPKQAMFVENFKDEKGKPFPVDQPLEVYYDLLTEDAETKVPKRGSGQREDQSEQQGSGQDEGGSQGYEWKKVGDFAQENEQAFDEHGWGDGDATEAEQLQAAKELIKRTLERTSDGYSQLSKTAKDALEEIERKLKQYNYKDILLKALKKSAPNACRSKTWHRPNKHYGKYAKGSKRGKYPSLYFLIDTSGSISVKEANEFLEVTNQFMTAGVTKAKVGLFHTELYKEYPTVKKKFKLPREDVESGGTDLTHAIQHVIKQQPDMLVILTDGYFCMPSVDVKKIPELITVVNTQGTKDHPLKEFGRTLSYEFKKD